MVLRIGQKVPDFTLPDSDKQDWTLSESSKDGDTLLTFFPFAFSGVCDREMCTFRDSLADLGGLKVSVAAVSVDSVFTLRVFKETYDLGFPLLSDFNKKVTKAYDVLQDPWVGFGYRGVAKRSVFLLDRKMILRYRWVTDVPGVEPPYEQVTEALTKLG